MNEIIKNWELALLGGGVLAASLFAIYLAASTTFALLSFRRVTQGRMGPFPACRLAAPCLSKQRQFILYFSLVFLLGFAGGITMKAFLPANASPSLDQAARGARLLGRLERDLHLTGSQVERIAPIATSMSERLDSLRRERSAQIVQVFDGFDSVIEGDLTLEQERQLQAIDAQRRDLLARGERATRLETF